MERDELLAKIVEIVSREGGVLRRKQIAVALGYAKSPHVIEAIEELVGDDKPLVRTVGTYRHKECWLYGLKCNNPRLEEF